MSTATFTELLRKPKEVLKHIDEGQVRITRRDGDDLVILRGHDHDVQEEGIRLSSRLFLALARHDGDAVASVRELFAWTAEFSDAEVQSYAEEMKDLVYSASELGIFERLIRAQTEWKETAAAYASGLGPVRADELLSESVPVERP